MSFFVLTKSVARDKGSVAETWQSVALTGERIAGNKRVAGNRESVAQISEVLQKLVKVLR